MASKSFAINTEPHAATIGEHTLLFQPEVVGAEFASAYSALKEAQKAIADAGDNVGAAELNIVNEGMRTFIGGFLLDESAELFDTLRLPDRVLVQLLEWISELYGGGSGKARPKAARGGSSSPS